MKFKISKGDFSKLPEAFQSEYTETSAGDYQLTIEGYEDFLVPKEKKDLAEQHRKAAEAKLKEAETRGSKLLEDLEAAKNDKGKTEEIRQNYEKEVAKIREESAAQIKQMKQAQYDSMIRETATKFAGEHSTVPGLFADAYAKRLSVEEVDGTAVIRVLDENGKPSVLSLDQYNKEILAKPEFKPIIKASQGSGGGAKPNQGSGGGAPVKSISKEELDAMDQDQRHTFFVKEGGRVES